jgi:hypothetical protein
MGGLLRHDVGMKELLSWLARLDAFVVGLPERKNPMPARHYRVASSSKLQFDGTVVKIAATDRVQYPFSSFPVSISVLTWWDIDGLGEFLDDQAIATQLGALLTLSAGRRIQVASREVGTSLEGRVGTTFLPTAVDDRELFGPVPIAIRHEFEQRLAQLAGLDSDALSAVGSAIDLHYASTLLFETDLQTATTLLVAGLEALAGHFEKSSATWTDFPDNGRLDKTFEEIGLSDQQVAALKAELLRGQRGSKRRFVSYVVRRLPKAFWGTRVVDFVPEYTFPPDGSDHFTGFKVGQTTPMAQWVPSDRKELATRLGATYDVRSRFVHAGKRPPTTFTTTKTASGGSTNAKDPLPYAALRRILKALIDAELANSTPAQLPDFKLVEEPPTGKRT